MAAKKKTSRTIRNTGAQAKSAFRTVAEAAGPPDEILGNLLALFLGSLAASAAKNPKAAQKDIAKAAKALKLEVDKAAAAAKKSVDKAAKEAPKRITKVAKRVTKQAKKTAGRLRKVVQKVSAQMPSV